MWFKRLIPWLIAGVNVIFFEAIISRPSNVWWLALGLAVVVVGLVSLLTIKTLQTRVALRFWLVMFLLEVSTLLSLLFIENTLVKHLVVILIAVLTFLYAEYLYIYLYRREMYKIHSLEYLNHFINLLVFLLFSISIFAGRVFMNFGFWLTALAVVVLSLVIFILDFRASRLTTKQYTLPTVIGAIIIFEIFTVLTWLPFNFYIKAILLSAWYYLFEGVVRLVLQENTRRHVDTVGQAKNKQIYKIIFIFIGVWLVSLLTARWT